MAAIVTLDDGRAFYASNAQISGAYYQIGKAVCDRPRLRHWLLDLSERCAPFFDIDVRGLESADRDEFWRAAKRAYEEAPSRHEDKEIEFQTSASTYCVGRLLEEKAKIDAGEPPEDLSPYEIRRMDIDDVWLSESELEEVFQTRAKEYLKYLSAQPKH